jgi:hypothetical protein
MTPETYSELLKDLQKREKTLVPAYLAALRADPALTERFQARFTAAEIGGRFDDFAMLCCRRSAVQFLLRTVYVRVLEDLGALEPPRIRGDWGFAAFREVAPALGVREFLKYTFRDLAHDLPALFTPSAEELPLPSEDLCRETWDLWHRLDGDRPVYCWTSDTFESRFLGDLYQDLDAEVRKRFALLQTPPFVEKYILDHTLTPALVEFDPAKLRAAGDAFRLIDPTCGSGHFLIGAFHRLTDYWQAHGVPDPWEAAQRALESVWGCDINPHAVDIARFRLMLEIRARTEVTQFERLASLALNLHVMDSLIPWERGMSNQGELFPSSDRLSVYATPIERAKNAAFLIHPFHVVVGNPPFITPKDPQKRSDYKIFWPNSCHMNYALAAPFVERFFCLGEKNAFVGQITANSFMKRQFGTKLIESVLPNLDLTTVIDTSGAYIPGHATPTVLLLGRNRSPSRSTLRVLLGKRGEPSRPSDPSHGLVWQAIEKAPAEASDESLFITVANAGREIFSKHPWSLGGGLSATVKEMIETPAADHSVLELLVASAGFDIITRAPDIEVTQQEARRARLFAPLMKTYLAGDEVRDYSVSPQNFIPVPYDATGKIIALDQLPDLLRFLWPLRSGLARRFVSGGTRLCDVGLPHHALPQYPSHKHKTALSITFAFVATHNHFAIDRGGGVFNRSAPILKLPASATIDDHLSLCGLLNSSTLGFWMKQVIHDKGNGGLGRGISNEDWERRSEYDATKLLKAPIVERDQETRVDLMRALENTARERAECLPKAVLILKSWAPAELETTLSIACARYRELTCRMVALQEELDWLTYSSYSIIGHVPVVASANIEPLEPGHRPFELLFARVDSEADEGENSAWWSRHGHDRVTEIPAHYSAELRDRLQARMDLIEGEPKLQLIEQAAFKRRWQTPNLEAEKRIDAESYLLDRLEDLFAPGGPLAKPIPYRLEQIVDVWARDPRTVAVVGVWKGGDFDLTLAAEQLLRASGLADNPYRIFTAEGIRILAAWKHTWHLQDLEDHGEPLIDPDTGKPLESIPLPPNFDRAHFHSVDAFATRGKLNVRRERFIIFADLNPPRYGWNGWRDTERALAQIAAYELAERDPENPLPPPTTADPRRCGPTLGLWESLPDVKRWGDEATHAEFLSLAQEVCSQKTCPCTVVESWQALQQQARAKRPGRKGSLPVVQPSPKPASPPEPTTAAVTVEDRGLVFRDLLLFGDGGATLAELAGKWTRDPEHLTRVLDDLIASGDLKTRGRGRKKTFIATAVPGAKET